MLTPFAEVARAAEATRRSPNAARPEAAALRLNLERHAWDGELVPARLLRRRHAARLVGQRRVRASIPSRRAGRCFPARAARSVRAQAMDAVDRHLVRRDHGLVQLLDPPFDESTLESGLHQGLRSRRARERRPVHACRDLGVDGVRRARRQRPRVGAARHDQSAQPLADRQMRSPSTRPSPTSSRRTSTRSRRTRVAAAGPGTPARRAGCTG
mgnify:CR=1 FL=1